MYTTGVHVCTIDQQCHIQLSCLHFAVVFDEYMYMYVCGMPVGFVFYNAGHYFLHYRLFPLVDFVYSCRGSSLCVCTFLLKRTKNNGLTLVTHTHTPPTLILLSNHIGGWSPATWYSGGLGWYMTQPVAFRTWAPSISSGALEMLGNIRLLESA